jgi:hypothetical protein
VRAKSSRGRGCKDLADGAQLDTQIGIDENDQNAAQNIKGTVEAVFAPERDVVTNTRLVI